jgi:hypothetical protein
MDFPELLNRFAAAAASGNGDALADLFTPDGTYDDYFFGSARREAIKTMPALAEGARLPLGAPSTPRSGNTATPAIAYFDPAPRGKGARRLRRD